VARKQVIADLDRAVERTVRFFETADEHLLDGEQSARQVISHLVFWHGEYVRLITALADGRSAQPLCGMFRHYNAQAADMYAHQPLPELARQFAKLHAELDCALNRLSHWRVAYPHKEGIANRSVSRHIAQILAHIDGHITRLERVAKRKEGAK
jgi:hypothetical protein